MATPKVLLVDDTRLFLKLETEFFKHSSVIVLTAENGRQALETVRRERPDMVYMDLNMPEMDGAACCAAIKADDDLRSIPVVLVTTAGMNSDHEQCRQAGCDGFLTKPVDRKAFLDMGRRFIPGIDRREKRNATRLKVLFRINDGENRYGTCQDISSRGLFIASVGEVTLDDKVEVSMLLSGNSADLVEAWGRVAWVNSGVLRKKQQLPEGFGIEILSMSDESEAMIRRFMGQERPK